MLQYSHCFFNDCCLSYDAAVIQWITSYHKKSYGYTCYNTLARRRNVVNSPVYPASAFASTIAVASDLPNIKVLCCGFNAMGTILLGELSCTRTGLD